MYKDEIHELLDKYSIQNEVNEFYKSLLDGLERKYDLVPISTGFPALDQILNGGIHSNQLITIGARPSIGKTAFAISLIRNMLERDKKILFFSLAMSSKDIITRLVASISRVNLYNIINVNFGDDEFNGVMYSIDCLYDKALYIVDIPNISIETLLKISRTAVTEKHFDCILIDYFGLIDGIDSSSDKYERASKKLKELARWLNVPIITMLQLPRDNNQKEPSLADIPYAMDSLIDDSDVVLFLHRNSPQDETAQGSSLEKDKVQTFQVVKIIIVKNKNGDIGHTVLGFNGSTISFENIGDDLAYWDC